MNDKCQKDFIYSGDFNAHMHDWSETFMQEYFPAFHQRFKLIVTLLSREDAINIVYDR